jgi:hypothetical protein
MKKKIKNSNEATKVIEEERRTGEDFRGKFWDISEDLSSLKKAARKNRFLIVRIRGIEKAVDDLFHSLSREGRIGSYLKFKGKDRKFIQPKVTIKVHQLEF